MHNTDEKYDFLSKNAYKGMKRVDNYIKQVWAVQKNILESGKATMEELESFHIEKERIAEVRQLRFAFRNPKVVKR